MMARFILLGFGIAAITVSYWVFAVIADKKDIDASGLNAWLSVPKSIRNIEIPKQCGRVLISRQRISCGGGTCGPAYSFDFQTHYNKPQILEQLDLDNLYARTNATHIDLFTSSLPVNDNCHRYFLTISFDTREP